MLCASVSGTRYCCSNSFWMDVIAVFYCLCIVHTIRSRARTQKRVSLHSRLGEVTLEVTPSEAEDYDSKQRLYEPRYNVNVILLNMSEPVCAASLL